MLGMQTTTEVKYWENQPQKCVDSELIGEVVNGIVIVPHNCHKNHKMAGQKYDHRLKNKKYITPLPYSWDVG